MQDHCCSQRPARLRLGGTNDRPVSRARAEGSGGPDNSRLRKIDLAGNGGIHPAGVPASQPGRPTGAPRDRLSLCPFPAPVTSLQQAMPGPAAPRRRQCGPVLRTRAEGFSYPRQFQIAPDRSGRKWHGPARLGAASQVDRPAGPRISATSRPITSGARPLRRATLPPAALRRRRWRDSSAGQRRRRRLCRHFQIAQDGSGRKQPGPASPTPAVPGCWAGGLVGRGGIPHTRVGICPRRAVTAGQGRDQRGLQAPKTPRAFRSARKTATIPPVPREGRGGASTSRQRGARLAVVAGRVGTAGAPGSRRSRPSPEILIAPERSGWKQPHTATHHPRPADHCGCPGPLAAGVRAGRQPYPTGSPPVQKRPGGARSRAPAPAPVRAGWRSVHPVGSESRGSEWGSFCQFLIAQDGSGRNCHDSHACLQPAGERAGRGRGSDCQT